MGLDRSTYLRDHHGVAVTWLPFHLHPETPEGGIPAERAYARLHPDGAAGYLGHLATLASEAGLPFSAPSHVPNTRRTLEASEWVRRHDPDVFTSFHHAIFSAYWVHDRDIEDPDVLVALARESGLDHVDGLRTALRDRTMGPAVDAGKQAAFDAGATGTPAYLIDRRLLVPGAQPREVFDRIVSRLRSVDGGPRS